MVKTRWLVFLVVASCTVHSRDHVRSGPDGSLIFDPDDNSDGPDLNMTMSIDDLSMSLLPPDFYGLQSGTGVYADLSLDRDAGCAVGQTVPACSNPLAASAGCTPNVSDPEICGNGLDDNCDGHVDEGCPCTVGAVQRCFAGPPGKRNIGGCTDGQQTCVGTEFGFWDDCVGSIGPRPESCDGLDNDCNGCADDGLCCAGGLVCPAPNDPRIAPVAPYTDKPLLGGDFFSGTATQWYWQVEGGPCDRMFAGTGFTPKLNPRPQSFTISNAASQNATVHFTLSGDYTVTLTVVDDHGLTYSCNWVQHVIGPGVRFELCWDHQGDSTQKGADLDLHVHRTDPSGTQTAFYTGTSTLSGTKTADDCFWGNCTADAFKNGPSTWYPTKLNWQLGDSPVDNCKGSKAGSTWMALGYCHNPRLDSDNVYDVGVPENINIDNPKDGDAFRTLVHYYGQDGSTTASNVTEHPMVNIYCGGQLKATYGKSPSTISGFNHGSGRAKGQIWRVADVAAIVDANGNTTDCTVNQLHAPMMTSGYWVVTDVNNTDFSY